MSEGSPGLLRLRRIFGGLGAFLRSRGVLLAVLAFLLTRGLVALSSGHLLFHLDPAEYGLIRTVAGVADTSTGELLTDRAALLEFSKDCTTVADTGLHLTLPVAGVLAHAAVTLGGAELGIRTARLLGIGVSLLALLSWLIAIGRSRGDEPEATGAWQGGFALLWLVPGAVLLKLSLSFWGTHDMVLALHALSLALMAGWIARPEPGTRAFTRSAAAGVLAALLTVLNTSLLLPSAFAVLWLSLAPEGAAAGAGRVQALVQRLVRLGLGAGAFLLAWKMVAGTAFFSSLGLQPELLANDKLRLLGSLEGGDLWERLGVAARSSWVLAPGMVAALWNLVARWRSGESGVSTSRFSLYCSAYLLVGWLGIAMMPFAFDAQGPDGEGPHFILRYTAHLHPVALAVLAAWGVDRSAWLGRWRLLAPAAWVLACLPGLLAMHDLGNLGAGWRYDGTRAFAEVFELNNDEEVLRHCPLGAVSDAFAGGLTLLDSYQYDDYWTWDSPRTARRVEHLRRVQGLASQRRSTWQGAEDEAEFYRGVGYALSVLVPPGRAGEIEPVLARLSGQREWILQGYGMEPVDLALRNSP